MSKVQIRKKQDFLCEHLKELPLRAIVAFAVRCARRVQSLAELPEGHAGRARLRADIEAALRMVDEFAVGHEVPRADSLVEALDASRRVPGISLSAGAAAAAISEAAHAAASAGHLTESSEPDKTAPREVKTKPARKFLGGLSRVAADIAAHNAFNAAVEAYQAVGLRNEEFVAAALRDYNTLVRLDLGHYPEAGDPIDPSPLGPLGPL